MRLIVDIGSNSSKCLLGRLDGNGKLETFFESSQACRISAGKGALVENAAQIISQSIDFFLVGAKAALRDCGIDECFSSFAVATSAMREAPNGKEVSKKVCELVGCEVKILSGFQEAELSFAGALSDETLPSFKSAAYFDLGGGSLEIVFERGGKIFEVKSFPVGAVLMTKKFFKNSDRKIEACELKNLRNFLRKNFEENMNPQFFDLLIGAGGALVAARKMAAVFFGEDNPKISLQKMELCLDEVCSLSLAQRVEKFGIEESRADIIPAAFACIAELMAFLKKDFACHTYRSLRHGVILKNFE